MQRAISGKIIYQLVCTIAYYLWTHGHFKDAIVIAKYCCGNWYEGV